MGKVIIETGEISNYGQELLKELLDDYFGIDHSVEINEDEIIFKES